MRGSSKPKAMSLNYDLEQKKIKILMIGDSGVGKTSLVSRFVRNKFHEAYISTLGIDFQEKQIFLQGKNTHLQIWDTAGQERFHTITKAYYRGTEGIIIAFSLNSLDSFKQLQYWLRQIQEQASSSCVLVLVGTKSDIFEGREVMSEEIAYFAQKHRLKYIETSAKLNLGVEEAFQTIAEAVLSRTKVIARPIKPNLDTKVLKEAKQSKRSRC